MSLLNLLLKLRTRYRYNISSSFGRRMVHILPSQSIVSFTFDDFPQSALLDGGAILNKLAFRGTFYVSLGLMDQKIPSGRAFSRTDLHETLAGGHELGCHTFAHLHSWDTQPVNFEASIVENREALELLEPGAQFKSLSYPISWPRPETKRRAARHYGCCRGGGTTFNLGWTDANNLKAVFIEKHLSAPEGLTRLIADNSRANGWLIFATHDVSENPTPYGCTPRFFETVVRAVADSGSRVLPVGEAWELLQAGRQGKANS